MSKTLFIIAYPAGAKAHGPFVGVIDEHDADPAEVAARTLTDLASRGMRWANDTGTILRIFREDAKRNMRLRHDEVVYHTYDGPPRKGPATSLGITDSRRKNYF